VTEPKYGALAAPDDEPQYVDDASPFDPPPAHPYAPVPGELGNGFLGKLSKSIYWYGIITVLLAITALPAFLFALFLEPVAANLPLLAIGLIPLGPAISAALYTVRARYRSEDAGPWRAFWRGYRLNFTTILKFWIPALVILGIIGFSLAFGNLVGLTTLYRVGLVVVAAVVLAWAMHAITIATFFNFRFSDTMRLAGYQFWAQKRATLGLLAIGVVAFGLLWFVNMFALMLAGGVLALIWYQQERRVLNDVYNRFTVPIGQSVN